MIIGVGSGAGVLAGVGVRTGVGDGSSSGVSSGVGVTLGRGVGVAAGVGVGVRVFEFVLLPGVVFPKSKALLMPKFEFMFTLTFAFKSEFAFAFAALFSRPRNSHRMPAPITRSAAVPIMVRKTTRMVLPFFGSC
jgi:hypothetical protein